MNKHTKLVVSVLFVFIIILSAAITRFYLDSPEDKVNKKNQAEIVKRLDVDSAGNRIFEDSAGNYGIVDGSDRITAVPEWLSLGYPQRNPSASHRHSRRSPGQNETGYPFRIRYGAPPGGTGWHTTRPFGFPPLPRGSYPYVRPM